jgi:hypothetical protein
MLIFVYHFHFKEATMENLFELFREYLNMSQGLQLPAYSLEQIVKNKVELPGIF